ncbi:sulfite exporter TauE/SafE family protein 3-like [Olea europaea var. sylvestris]|uniref:sulfite exporter TauE/SafE family protein 3-like n=1 Tax=Olea europaea var. sylvestris TaxID=158386 RepID=UPI000C1D59E2|nr:sulfite exporter TauE/SafE family protein 3-like [Olea europaea var. sylvestris]
MAGNRENLRAFRPLLTVVWSFLLASIFVSAEGRSLKQNFLAHNANGFSHSDLDILTNYQNFTRQANKSGYQHVWPDLKFNWQIVVGSIIGFFGASFGSVGGVGGGGVFVPMLTLVIGFDPKSSAAISKCMIMGAAVSTVCYNLKLRHPTIDMPIIDYDLAVLIQPMLMLGISIGVAFNVIFSDWMVTVLLIILFIATSSKAFFKGVETWKKETLVKKETVKQLEASGNVTEEADNKLHSGGLSNDTENEAKDLAKPKVGILENVRWNELGLLVFVWMAFLAVQIIKNYTATCSAMYWVMNLLQIPVSLGVSGYESICLYKGWRKIASKGDGGSNLKVHQLIIYCLLGVLAGTVGGLLGVGGGSIMGPLFLELGVPPQVASATSTFAMMFSSSMSVVEYYLLKRFPVPYALCLVVVATVAAFIGQHVVRKVIIIMGRASIIIFVLASIIFVSAISLGGVGISNMIGKIERHEYMGFENLCKYNV